MDDETPMTGLGQKRGHGTTTSYTLGYILSILLTVAAYLLVKHHMDTYHLVFSHHLLIASVIGLAIVQLFVQLMFFLHLGRESKPRFNLLILFFAAIVVLILVGGSLWIMSNLSYRMTPQQMSQYMKDQESGGL